MKFKIEKNIPFPTHRRLRSKENAKNTWDSKYPWENMEVGDSIFVKSPDPLARQRSITNSYGFFVKQNRLTWKFRTHSGDGGVRVWRIE